MRRSLPVEFTGLRQQVPDGAGRRPEEVLFKRPRATPRVGCVRREFQIKERDQEPVQQVQACTVCRGLGRGKSGFHRAVFDAYEELAAAYPQRIIAVDGERDPGVIAEEIWTIVSDRQSKDGAA